METDKGYKLEPIGVIDKDWKRGAFVGRGAFGTVYKVESLKDKRKPKYVVKEFIGTDEYLKSFETETLVLRSVGSHERIVPFIGTSKCDNTLLLFLKYMEMGSLRKYSKNKNGLTEVQTSFYTRQILEGLDFLHTSRPKIIHRDLKGENVLMESEYHIRLTDFGISKILQDGSRTASFGVGSLRWMAPEVLGAKEEDNPEYDEKSDIWSLGCTVIEMITAHSPYKDMHDPQIVITLHNGKLPSLDNASKILSIFLSKTINMDPTKRPTAKDLLKNNSFLSRGIFTMVSNNETTQASDYASDNETTQASDNASTNEITHASNNETTQSSKKMLVSNAKGNQIVADHVLFMVGRSGNGKSFVRDSIARMVHPQGSDKNVSSKDGIAVITGRYNSNNSDSVITVCDGFSIDDNYFEACKTDPFLDAFLSCPQGFTALLIVLKYEVPFTKQEKHAISLIKYLFGEDCIRNYGIIAFTYGDNFELDHEVGDIHTNFSAWCREQRGDIQDLFQEVDNRFVIFNNRTQDETKLKKQWELLYENVKRTKSKGFYSYELCCENLLQRSERIVKQLETTEHQDVFDSKCKEAYTVLALLTTLSKSSLLKDKEKVNTFVKTAATSLLEKTIELHTSMWEKQQQQAQNNRQPYRWTNVKQKFSKINFGFLKHNSQGLVNTTAIPKVSRSDPDVELEKVKAPGHSTILSLHKPRSQKQVNSTSFAP